MRFPIGAMSLGDILDRALKILLARFPVLFAIYLLVQLPLILFELVIPLAGGEDAILLALGGLLGALLFYLIFIPLAQAVILYVVMREYVDRPATLGEAFRFALSRFGAVLGSVIIAGILSGLAMICCIPGIYLKISWAFVAEVAVLEGLGGMDALNRSMDLVKGHWWRVFGVLLLVGFIAAFINGILTQVLNVVLPAAEVIPTNDPFRPNVHYNYVNHSIQVLTSGILTTVFGAYQAVCATLLYLDLRIRKEGFDLEMEAQKEEPPPQ